MAIELRDYQQCALDDIRGAIASGSRSPLFCLPTGGGKSVVLRAIAEGAAAKGKRIVALAHRRELTGQLAGKHLAHLAPGLIEAGRPETPGALVQVASVQTLARRLDRIQPPDILLIDEAHHAPAGTWRAVREAWQGAVAIGVTATPCRLDGRGLGEAFDRLILGPSARELTAAGHLVPADVYAPSVVDLAGVRTRAGDWRREDLEAAIAGSSVVGDAVESFQEHVPTGTAVAFCVSVAHAKITAEAFQAAGVPAAVLTGSDKPDVREATLADLAAGRIRILASVDVISEGFDLPNIAAAISLRPTKSLALWLQQVGRALRPAEGKDRAIVLDHAGNALRHGLPSEDRDWSLDGGAPRRTDRQVDEAGAPLSVRQCLQCYAVHPSGPMCPMCGHENPTDERIPRSQAGELKRLEAEELERVRAAKRAEERGEKTLEDWLTIARERGYKPGWAYARHGIRQRRGGGRRRSGSGATLDAFAGLG